MSKPKSATIEEWAEWTVAAKKKKFCYWLTETVPLKYRVMKMRWLDNIWKLVYRYHPKHKYHLIDTGLKPDYYEIDERMLHGMFNLLVEYVEVENAWRLSRSDDSKPVKTGREVGLEAIDWQIQADGDLDDKWSKERRAAWEEIKFLYLWWKDVHPTLLEQIDNLTGEALEDGYGLLEGGTAMEKLANRTEEQKAKARAVYEKQEQLKEVLFAKENEMMGRLFKVRRSLWS